MMESLLDQERLLQQRLAAIQQEEDRLKPELLSIRKQLSELRMQTKAIRESSREQKILKSIESMGGREKFIRYYGHGRTDALNLRPDQCSEGAGPADPGRPLFDKECEYLGVPPRRWRWHCSNRGKYFYRGRRWCGIHMRMRFGITGAALKPYALDVDQLHAPERAEP